MSFNIGLSGLRTVSEELGVISNNIANVNTAGFKAGRAEFAAIYSGGRPGGVEISNVSQDFGRNGDVVGSGRALDLAISGAGFFKLEADGQVAYTRAGMFHVDSNNNIVAANGMQLQGHSLNADGQIAPEVGGLKVATGTIPAKATTSVEFVANLKADASTIDITAADYAFDPSDINTYNFSQSSQIYDSLGVEHTLSQYFVKSGTNQWVAHYYMDGQKVSTSGIPGGTDGQNMVFNTDGSMMPLPGVTTAAGDPTTSITLQLTPSGADAMTVSLDLSKVSQYASNFAVTRNQSDGYTAGEMTGVHIEPDGSVMAEFNNGRSLLQGQVVMANFANPNGLQQQNDTTWTQTFASGQPVIGVAGTGGLGTLTSGAYEGSNVELTGELVNLMTAQRNYQANAKSLSTADKMTQVLFNAV